MLQRTETQFEFGPFRLIPARRALAVEGRGVMIHGRAFDLLAALVENRDRVVSRDELLSVVWAGTTVSDSNIAVQVAALRRVLAAHGADPKAIVNVPGRGYQFVGDVVMRMGEPAHGAPAGDASAGDAPAPGRPADEASTATAASTSPGTIEAPRDPGRMSRHRWPILAVMASILLVVAAGLILRSRPSVSPTEDRRLTIGFRPFEAVGPAPAASLAVAYTNAIRTRPRRYGDVRFYEAERAATARPFHFELSGTVQVIGSTAELSYTVVDQSGELVARDHFPVPFAPLPHELSSRASAVLGKIAADIFKAEARSAKGSSGDALDFLIQAKAECPDDATRAQLDRAIADDEQALQRAPLLFPARLFMVFLLEGRLSLRPAADGDADGDRALAIVDGLLGEDPDNIVAIQFKALALVELGRPDMAENVVRHGLALDPHDPFLLSTLLDAYEESGRFGPADALVAGDDGPSDNALLAQLYFAEGRDAQTLEQLEPFLSNEPVDLERRLMMLLKAASLARLGRMSNASDVVREAVAGLPPAFRTQAGLRRTFYEMAPPAWASFKAALTQAGMPI